MYTVWMLHILLLAMLKSITCGVTTHFITCNAKEYYLCTCYTFSQIGCPVRWDGVKQVWQAVKQEWPQSYLDGEVRDLPIGAFSEEIAQTLYNCLFVGI